MLFAKTLLLASALAGVRAEELHHEVDCSAVEAWEPRVYGGARASDHASVHHKGVKYNQQWWAGATNVPGEDPAWLAEGKCLEGTTGEDKVKGPLEVDCSDAPLWEAKVYPGSRPSEMAAVHYEDIKYLQKWWAGVTDRPGKSEAWLALGKCKAGTTGGNNIKGPPKVDCSDATPWAAKIYSGAKEEDFATVHHKVVKYRQQWWAGATDVPGKSGAWRAMGDCVPGTNGKGSDDSEVSREGVLGFLGRVVGF